MDLRTLRYFESVAREKSFRGAAKRVGVSQPAVSQAIALLEEELGARLFDRTARSVELTPQGRLLVDPVRRALAAADEVPRVLDEARGVLRGRLEIGTTDVASIYVLPKVYRAFRRQHPSVELSVRVEGTESLLRQMSAGEIELAVITLAAGDRELDLRGTSLEASPLFEEKLEFFVARKHAMAGRRKVELPELSETPLITFKSESITRQAIDRVFQRRNLTPRIAMEISSPEAIKKLVEVGLGAGVLPAHSIRAEVRAGSLVTLPVRGGALSRVLGVVRDGARTSSTTAEAFLDLVEPIRNVPRSGGPAAAPA